MVSFEEGSYVLRVVLKNVFMKKHVLSFVLWWQPLIKYDGAH
jgi:hypothetical protein